MINRQRETFPTSTSGLYLDLTSKRFFYESKADGIAIRRDLETSDPVDAVRRAKALKFYLYLPLESLSLSLGMTG